MSKALVITWGEWDLFAAVTNVSHLFHYAFSTIRRIGMSNFSASLLVLGLLFAEHWHQDKTPIHQSLESANLYYPLNSWCINTYMPASLKSFNSHTSQTAGYIIRLTSPHWKSKDSELSNCIQAFVSEFKLWVLTLHFNWEVLTTYLQHLFRSIPSDKSLTKGWIQLPRFEFFSMSI